MRALIAVMMAPHSKQVQYSVVMIAFVRKLH